MSGPPRILWLSIYLTILLFLQTQCIGASEVNTEEPNTTLSPSSNSNGNNENYELIDVAKNNGGNGDKLNVKTGETTRIFTTGEVDEDFWLKHLGEDFKYAIHFQVGENDQYNGIYNMTEDGANYDVQHEYGTKSYPVDKNEQHQQHQQQHEQNLRSNAPESANRNENIERAEDEKYENGNDNDNLNVTVTSRDQYEDNFEQVFAIDEEGMNLIKQLRALKKQQSPHLDDKYTKVQNINIKYAPRQNAPTQQYQQQQQQRDGSDPNGQKPGQEFLPGPNKWESKASPIVVNLPENEKEVHHLSDEETPVVVKMPPVIYHHSTSYPSTTSEHTKSLNNEQQQKLPPQQQPKHPIQQTKYIQHTQQQQQPQQYKNPDFTQYNTQQHKIQQQQQLRPSSIASPPYYNQPIFDEPAAFARDSVYHTPTITANSVASLPPKEKLQKPPGSFRFILRKPSAPYN